MCEVCGHILEDVLHTIRDNTAARNIWNLLIPFDWHNIFYSDNLWANLFALSGKALTCSTQILTHCTHLVGNWACLNTDGSIRYGNDFLAVGGTMRNRNGKWILGFNVLLESCSVLEVGLWGILDGLGILVDWGYDHVLIQTDSLEVAKVIQKRLTEKSNSSLIRRIL
ncbi:hypothetical protein Gorai_016230 [Gossypium raimondii]|uniref:RNase H type-1 domain-containing protein n=1 Tax=Gossypium raimondii TaxID=29730 RepID=A0A7J8P8E3_GOSRA|nr:hypothetical protein [Gossypium raimondii]